MARIDESVKVMLLKGETGASIESIDKTGSDGLVDTYAVRLTDGSEHRFYVQNGRNGEKGEKGDTGSTISVPVSGLFNLGVDSDGNLIASYNDAGTGEAPKFEYDRESGNVYYII
nr:MAG TPA: hypothetical protein [Caudoviricetes sp.]